MSIDICTIDHFDAVKFSKYLPRIKDDIQDTCSTIYSLAEKNGLYCPEIESRATYTMFSWYEKKKYLKVVVRSKTALIEYYIGDNTFNRKFLTTHIYSKIDRTFLELGLFVNGN